MTFDVQGERVWIHGTMPPDMLLVGMGGWLLWFFETENNQMRFSFFFRGNHARLEHFQSWERRFFLAVFHSRFDLHTQQCCLVGHLHVLNLCISPSPISVLKNGTLGYPTLRPITGTLQKDANVDIPSRILPIPWMNISPWNIQNDISISHIISQYITYDIPCDMPCATWLGVIVLCLSKLNGNELGMPPIFRHSQNNTSLVSCISITLNITIIYGWFYISKIVVGELYPHSIQGYHKTAGLHLVKTLLPTITLVHSIYLLAVKHGNGKSTIQSGDFYMFWLPAL